MVTRELIGTVYFESGVIGHRLVVPESPEFPREKQGLSGRSGHVLGNIVAEGGRRSVLVIASSQQGDGNTKSSMVYSLVQG